MCIVTGGSSGLGLATVTLFLKCDFKVAIIDLSESSQFPDCPNILFIKGDVSSYDQVQRAVQLVVDKFQRVDILVNCAGKMAASPIYSDSEVGQHCLEIFQDMVNVNLIGTFNVCRFVVAEMVKNTPDSNSQRGLIINTSSVAGLDGLTKAIGYSASKAAVAVMTLPMARELSQFGIRVMAIAPGPFRTPLITDKKSCNGLIELIPFPRRPGNPSEFAELVLSIVQNAYLNGEVIRLDAGLRVFNQLNG